MTQPLLTADVSVFRGSTNTTPVEQLPLTAMLDRIQDETYQQYVMHLRQLRAAEGKESYDDAKKKSMAFTPAGVFARRANAHLTTPSGLVHFDFDHPARLADAKARLIDDPYVAYAFISPSGDGLKVAVWADGIVDDRTYKHAWQTVLAMFDRCYPDLAVANDGHCKDIARLCYASWDTELYRNPDSLLFVVPYYQAPVPKPPTPPAAHPQTRGEGEQARTEDALQGIPADDYDTWLRVGMALHASGETWGRAAWDTWSQRSDKYKIAMQNEKWGSFTSDGGVNLATVFHLAQQHGYTPPQRASLHVSANGSTHQGTQQAPTGAATAQMWGSKGTPQTPPPRPDIFLNTEMTRIVDETQDALLALPHAPIIYQRARHLTVISWDVPPPKWLHRPHDMPVMLDASTARLTELASQGAQYWKYDKRTKKWNEALPPGWVIETLTSRPGWPFPLLEGIVSSPTLRPDGSLLATPGYDTDTGLYLDTNGTTFPPLPAAPSLDDARSAVGALQEGVQDFPFAEPWHFSATVAAICSLVCRFAVQGCVPLFAIRANTRGSGKSLLADVISIVGTGRAAPRWPQVTEEEEDRKRLLTVALAGYPCLHIDNVTRPLGSPSLDLALTSASFSDRILGTQESREAPLTMVWLASGNNMLFKGDTARRIVPIDLDAKMEKPEERTGFHYEPLVPWIRQERPRLAMAALTLVQAFFHAGCPHQGLTQLGSFEEWSALIRHALVWAGEADPCEGRKDLEAESNPEYEQLAALLDAWAQCYPSQTKGVTLKTVGQDIGLYAGLTASPPTKANAWDDFRDALGAYDTKYDGKNLKLQPVAYALRAIQGRVIGGKRLVNVGTAQRAVEWCLKQV